MFSFIRNTLFSIRLNDDYTVYIEGHKICLKKVDFHGADGAGGNAKLAAIAFFGVKQNFK